MPFGNKIAQNTLNIRITTKSAQSLNYHVRNKPKQINALLIHWIY